MPQLADWPRLDAVQPLAPREFDQIRQLAYRTFGLDLKPGKEELVAVRLRRLVSSGGFRSYREYYKNILSDNTGQSLLAMIDALATNHTSFFREAGHFDYLKNSIVPMLTGRDPVEIWSAACSTGEEVWTLAMVLNEAFPSRAIRITASDVSGKALAIAERGEYPLARCQGVPRYGCRGISWRTAVPPKVTPSLKRFGRKPAFAASTWWNRSPGRASTR